MTRAALIVEIVDTADGKRSEYTFAKSPVRIGRSPLNDLPVDRPFVSHCHGLINFDDFQCHFVDLGSTNGTHLGEQRLERNEPVRLSAETQLSIGTLLLNARTVRQEKSQSEDARGTYAFRRSELLGGSERPVASAPGPARPSGVQAAGPIDGVALSAALRRALPGMFRPGMEGPVVERLIEALDRFAQAFLELARGQQQLARDLSLPVAGSEVSQAQDAMELVSSLVDLQSRARPLDELSRAHADLMLHQVALLNATRAGARALLAELAPEALVPAQRGPLRWLSRLMGRDARWEAFRRRYEELGEETALSSVLFGKAFRRAYAATMGETPSMPTVEPEDKP